MYKYLISGLDLWGFSLGRWGLWFGHSGFFLIRRTGYIAVLLCLRRLQSLCVWTGLVCGEWIVVSEPHFPSSLNVYSKDLYPSIRPSCLSIHHPFIHPSFAPFCPYCAATGCRKKMSKQTTKEQLPGPSPILLSALGLLAPSPPRLPYSLPLLQ